MQGRKYDYPNTGGVNTIFNNVFQHEIGAFVNSEEDYKAEISCWKTRLKVLLSATIFVGGSSRYFNDE